MGDLIIWIVIGLFFSVLRTAMRQRKSVNDAGVHSRFSARNLPLIFLFLAGVLGLLALFLGPVGSLAMADPADLKLMTGTVQPPSFRSIFKTRGAITIPVQAEDGQHDLIVEDFTHSQEIKQLRPGDHVTALVAPFFGQLNVWELKHNKVTIQSYHETYLFRARQMESGAAAALWLGFVASIFLTFAIASRMYFGTWRDATPPTPIMEAAAEFAARQKSATPSPALQNSAEFGPWLDSASSFPATQPASDQPDAEPPWQWTKK